MDKTVILIYGALLGAGEHGNVYKATEEDEALFKSAINRAYGVNIDSSEEQVSELQKELDKDLGSLIAEYREKIKQSLEVPDPHAQTTKFREI